MGLAVCTTHSPFSNTPATELPAGLPGTLIAEHHGVSVSELTREQIGEGLMHTVQDLGMYRKRDLPRIYSVKDGLDSTVADQITALYRELPTIAFIGSADGLGHPGFQNAYGFSFVMQCYCGRCVVATAETVRYPAEKRDTPEPATFAEECNRFMDRIIQILDLDLKLQPTLHVPFEEAVASFDKPGVRKYSGWVMHSGVLRHLDMYGVNYGDGVYVTAERTVSNHWRCRVGQGKDAQDVVFHTEDRDAIQAFLLDVAQAFQCEGVRAAQSAVWTQAPRRGLRPKWPA